MARIIVGAVVVCAIVLLCPATGYAGQAKSVEVIAVSADPEQIANGTAMVDCSAGVGQCSFTRPNDGTLTPAVTFTTTTSGTMPFQFGLWVRPPNPDTGDPGNLDCSGDPDFDSGARSADLPTAGSWIIYLTFQPSLMAGDTLSLEWIVDSCPITACVNFDYGIAPPAC